MRLLDGLIQKNPHPELISAVERTRRHLQSPDLVNLFASLYPTADTIKRLTERARVDCARLDFTNGGRTIWYQLLVEASAQHREEKLVEIAAVDFPDRKEEFEEALQSFLRMHLIDLLGKMYRDEDEAWTVAVRAGISEMTKHGGDALVTVYEAALYPICEPYIERRPLHELSSARIAVASTLYVPPSNKAQPDLDILSRLNSTAGIHNV